MLFPVALISCKKNKNVPEPGEKEQLKEDAKFNNTIAPGLGNVFFQQALPANTLSLLVAKLAYNMDTVAIFGQTNSASQLADPHTLVMSSNNNKELLVTEVFAETLSSRTYMIVNNVKSNIVTEIKHYTADTKELSILDFNHQTGTSEILWSVIVEKDLIRPISKASARGKVMAGATGFSDVAMCGKPAPEGELDKKLDEVLKYLACGSLETDSHLAADVVISAFKSGFEKVKLLNAYFSKIEEIELTRKAMEREGEFFRKADDINWDGVKSTKEDLKSELKEIEKIKPKEPFTDKRNIVLAILNEATALSYDEYEGKKIELSISAIDLNTGEKGTPLIVELVLSDPESGDKVYMNFAPVTRTGTAEFTFDPLTMNNYRKVKGLVANYHFTLNGVKKSYTRAISLRFIGPEALTVVSGNGQSAEPGKKLSMPLKVKVTDAKGRPVKDAVVEWVVSSGGGSIDAPQSLSQADGTAEMGWTLGLTGNQVVEAKVKRPDGTLVSGAPVTFSVGASVIGRWNLVTRSYQESGGSSEVDSYSGKGFYLDLRADNTYSVSFSGEGGTGTYAPGTSTLGFQLLTGDDDLTDEDTYAIKKLTATELVLEKRGSDYVYEISFSR